MSDESQYWKNGELPPQGIGPDVEPEKSVQTPNRTSFKNFVLDHFRDRDLKAGASVNPVKDTLVVVVSTGPCDGFEKHMGDSLRWQVHFALRDLENELGRYDLGERARLDIMIEIPITPNVRLDKNQQAYEPKGVDDDAD